MVMEKPMTDLAHVERELADLAGQLKQSFKVLDGLADVQLRFEELSRTYQRFKEFVEKNNASLGDVSQLQKSVDQRFVELETVFKTRSEEIRNQLSRTQGELSTIDRNLNTELTQQVSLLKRDMDERFGAIIKEWQQYRETMQVPIEEFEARLMAELKATLNRMNQSSGLSSTHLEKLDAQVLNARSTLRTVEKQVRAMRTWLVITTLLSILALGLPIAMFISQSGLTGNTEETAP
jgi:DNA repair exonuclease SbcCD ATPase subunit